MPPIIDHEQIENSVIMNGYYDNKKLFYRNVFWFLFGNAAASFGVYTAQSNLMPLHMAANNLNAQKISTILALSGWIGMPLGLYFAYLSDRWQWKMGRRLPFIAISLPFILLAMIIFPYATGFWSCLGVFTIFLIFNQVKFAAYPYLMNDISKQKYWGRIGGIGGVAQWIAVWLGQRVLMPMIDIRGEKQVYFIAACFVGIATVLTIIFVKEPPYRSPEPPKFNPVPVIWSTLKFGFSSKRNVLLYLAFSFICASALVNIYIPLQGKVNLGLTDGQVGLMILQYGTLSVVALSFFMGWAVDKIGSVKCLIIGFTLLAPSVLLGSSPVFASGIINKSLGTSFSGINVLAAAYIIATIGGSFNFTAAYILVMSSVHRKDVAKFMACNGALNVFMQSILLAITGVLITNLFNEQYGVAFIIAFIFVIFGVIIFVVIGKQNNKITSVISEDTNSTNGIINVKKQNSI
jgi:MFS family permease